MPSVIVHAIELSRLQYNAPSAQDIDAAFQQVNFGGGQWGGWVGPRPRITRRALIASGFETHAAYLYSWPDSAFTRLHNAYQRAQLQAHVGNVLATLSSDWRVSLENYAPAVNGPVAWWAGGQASITQTRDEFPTLTGRADAWENPTGPTTSQTHPTTVGDIASGLRGLAWPIAIVAAVVGGMYFLPSRRSEREPRERRSKPTRDRAEEEPSRRRRNPRPPEWDALPPDTLYRCHAYEAGLVGERVPGRGGGVVTMCATPHEPVGTSHRRGQVQLGLPGIGRTMKKSTARGRMRRAGLEREKARRGKATFSTAREAAQHRARAIAEGVDVTSAEYLDTLGGGEGRRRRGARA